MSSNLTLSLELNIKPLSDKLKEVQEIIKDAVNKATGNKIELTIDSGKIESGIETAKSSMDELEDTTLEIDADGSNALNEAAEVDNAIDQIPDDKNIEIKATGANDILTDIAKLGLGFQGLKALIAEIGKFFGEFFSLSNKQEDAVTSLEASLRNTGLEVEENSSRLRSYASEIQNVTRYGDELILSGTALAQNIGRFSAEELPKVQKAAVGLAATYKMDLNTAFQLIGRASKGQTQMLTRYGIVLDSTKSKEEQFAEIMEIGAKNFRIAEDEANNGSGALEQYANLIGDLKEKIGDALKLAILPLVKGLSSALKTIQKYPALISAVVASLVVFGTYITILKAKQILLNTALAIGQTLLGNWKAVLASVAVGAGVYAAQTLLMKENQDSLNMSNQEAVDLLKEKGELEKKSLSEQFSLKQDRLEDIYIQEKELAKKELDLKISLLKVNDDLARVEIENDLRILKTKKQNLADEKQSLENWLEEKGALLEANKSAANDKYYEEMGFAAEGFYDRELQLLKEERDEQIASGDFTIKQANAIYAKKKSILDKERAAYIDNEKKKQNAAKEQMESFFASIQSERDQLQQDFESKKSLAEIAYADDPEQLRAVLTKLSIWYEEEQNKLTNTEIERQKAEYEAAIRTAESKKALGVDYNNSLERSINEYLSFLKKTYGKDSDEYKLALAEKESATKNFWKNSSKWSEYYGNAIGNGIQSMFSGMIRVEVETENKLIQGFANMANSFIAEVERMIAKWITFQLIKGMLAPETTFTSFLGFAEGKYTGDGGKYEPAGIVHKGEWVLDQEVTQPNLRELPTLHRLLASGVRLRDILTGGVSITSLVSPAYNIPTLSYASGGYTDSGELGGMNERLEKIEKAIKNIKLTGEMIIKDITDPVKKHKVALKNKAAYERQYGIR